MSLSGSFYRVLRLVAVTAGLCGLGQQAWALTNVGYYDMSAGQGVNAQRDSIIAAGFNPVNVTVPNAAQLSGLDMLVVQNPSNSYYGAEFLANLGDIHAAVDAGMTLMIHDRHVTNYATILPNGGSFSGYRATSSPNTTFLVHGTELTNGPGGVLDDNSLDNGTSSHHGYVLGNTLPAGALAMMSRTNTNEIVTFSYNYGAGLVYYSTIPLDFYLAMPGYRPNFNIYAINAVAYGITLNGVRPIASITSNTTTEAGGTATFGVVMSRAPLDNVTVTLGVNDPTEGELSVTSRLFTPANWNIPQNITVTGVDDFIVDGNINYGIGASWSSSDPDANGANSNFVHLVNQDDDASGFIVDTSMTGKTSESGHSTTFTMALTAEPTSNVTVNFDVSDATEATITNSITFTPANWMTPQSVTVTGVDDELEDGDQPFTINYSIVTGDAAFAGLTMPVLDALTLINLDVEEECSDLTTAMDPASLACSDLADLMDLVPSNTSESGGGGAFNPLLLLAMGGLFLARRRRSSPSAQE